MRMNEPRSGGKGICHDYGLTPITANCKMQRSDPHSLRRKVPLGELCARHQISQAQYYQWRDQLFNHGAKVFDRGGPEQTEQRLREENRRLKTLVGELTVELKKSEVEPW